MPDKRIPRRREQQFFADPAVDRLMGTVMSLALEHYVLLDRVQALENALARAKVVDPAALVAEPQDPVERAAAQERAARFAASLLEPLMGIQHAKGTTARPRTRRRSRTTTAT